MSQAIKIKEEKLIPALNILIDAVDIDDNLTLEAKLLMADSLAEFCHQSIDKFRAGQKEHGGDIRDRDLSEELKKEQIDAFWYGEALFRWPRKLIKK